VIANAIKERLKEIKCGYSIAHRKGRSVVFIYNYDDDMKAASQGTDDDTALIEAFGNYLRDQ